MADAIAARADALFVQDSAFFAGRVTGLVIQVPSSLVWPAHALERNNVQLTADSWTFFGWFVPQWGSAVVHESTDRFFIFELARHIACFYEGAESAFKLIWNTHSGIRDTLTMTQEIETHSFNFVAVAVSPSAVFWFVNGETRGRRVWLGPAPSKTTFHPFMSAQSLHQIFGVCHWRAVPKALSERLIRKHWKARTVRLTDREVELDDMLGPLLIRPSQ